MTNMSKAKDYIIIDLCHYMHALILRHNNLIASAWVSVLHVRPCSAEMVLIARQHAQFKPESIPFLIIVCVELYMFCDLLCHHILVDEKK